MIITIIIQALLGLGFLMFGYQKFTSEDMKKGFEYFGYGNSFRIFTGSFEMLSAVVIIIGIWVKPLATIGGLMIVATMIGAYRKSTRLNSSHVAISYAVFCL